MFSNEASFHFKETFHFQVAEDDSKIILKEMVEMM